MIDPDDGQFPGGVRDFREYRGLAGGDVESVDFPQVVRFPIDGRAVKAVILVPGPRVRWSRHGAGRCSQWQHVVAVRPIPG